MQVPYYHLNEKEMGVPSFVLGKKKLKKKNYINAVLLNFLLIKES